jgi:hypothetical protein
MVGHYFVEHICSWAQFYVFQMFIIVIGKTTKD